MPPISLCWLMMGVDFFVMGQQEWIFLCWLMTGVDFFVMGQCRNLILKHIL